MSRNRARARIWSRVVLCPPDRLDTGCWEYTGRLNKQGYHRVRYQGTTLQLHVLMYELLIAPVGPGLEVHHRCENRGCCNPDHLETVTREEHQERHPRRWKRGL